MVETSKKQSGRRTEWIVLFLLLAFSALLIIPETIQFMGKTRVLETQTNLTAIRKKIELFERHKGRVPTSIEELLIETYVDKDLRQVPYLEKVPKEMILDSEGIVDYQIAANLKEFAAFVSDDEIFKPGGWIYRSDVGEIYVNVHEKLDRKWGEFKGEVPSQW